MAVADPIGTPPERGFLLQGALWPMLFGSAIQLSWKAHGTRCLKAPEATMSFAIVMACLVHSFNAVGIYLRHIAIDLQGLLALLPGNSFQAGQIRACIDGLVDVPVSY